MAEDQILLLMAPTEALAAVALAWGLAQPWAALEILQVFPRHKVTTAEMEAIRRLTAAAVVAVHLPLVLLQLPQHLETAEMAVRRLFLAVL